MTLAAELKYSQSTDSVVVRRRRNVTASVRHDGNEAFVILSGVLVICMCICELLGGSGALYLRHENALRIRPRTGGDA